VVAADRNATRHTDAGGDARSPGPQDGGPDGRHAETGDRRDIVTVGLLAAPGLVYELAEPIARKLPAVLRRRFPEVEWRVVLRPEPMAAASESDVDLVEAGRQRMLGEGWTLAVCLTDFPVHQGNRPVTAYASAASGVGLVSVPALGVVNLDDRVLDAVVRVIEGLLGESVDDPQEARDRRRRVRMRRRLEDLSSAMGQAEVREDRSMFFFAAVGLGNLRLLVGMIRANRPWRLVVSLSRAIVAALGLAIFGVASPGVWMIADGMGPFRLVAVALASILVTCVSLIAAHRLWERTYSDRPETRERVVLFNLATAATVAIGVMTLYVALFAIDLTAAAGVIASGVLEKQIGHPAGLTTYLSLACLVSTLSTLGGALGAALENDRAVREAAYGYRPDARTQALQRQTAAETGDVPAEGAPAAGASRG
jgi:uncharacterized membrane protein